MSEKTLCASNSTINPNSDVVLIAQWFLTKEQMSHKKLQKLCYYAEAWSLLKLGKDIVPNIKFEAWVHGPVCPQLYDVCKKFGWRDIMVSDEFKEQVDADLRDSLTPDQKSVLDLVWSAYGKFTADELESMTHSEEPWKNARKGLGMFEPSKKVITPSEIQDYYSKKYEEFAI